MPPITPFLACVSTEFIARIADPARRNRATDLTLGPPGFANPHWQRGAYLTTLARNPGETLLAHTRAAIATHVAAWPTHHANQAAFDLWHAGEIIALGNLVQVHQPLAFWSYGRAQKYINILLKYAGASFHSLDPHFARYQAANPGLGIMTPWLHAPVDRYTLKFASRLPGGNRTWRHLAWSHGLTPVNYAAIQAVLASASAVKGVSRIHYEMLYIW